MTFECFIEKNFNRKALDVIQKANRVIEKYQALGMRLTLRQIYYQFVANDLFVDKFIWTGSKWIRDKTGEDPRATINAEPNYDMLGTTLSNARLAGLVDWDAMEDRTRQLRGIPTKEHPFEAIEDAARGYFIDVWKGQPVRVEVWIEKDALVGVIERQCWKYQVDYFSCRGYGSQSELYTAGKRIKQRWEEEDQNTVVLHLGDHDPSGLDMTRDNTDRLSMFAERYVDVRRLALNMDQVKKYDPPPNPTKLTDTRANAYIEEHGVECWELDALEPQVIGNLVEDNIKQFIDWDLWEARHEQHRKDKTKLAKAVDYVRRLK